MVCPTCDNTGWVCDEHCHRPWLGPKACCCGAAGLPCLICNGDGHVSRLLKSVLQVRDKKVL
jgi:hypothetical protein